MNNNNYFPLERNRYFYGKMLTARDFETEQRYFNNKRRLINRTIFGAGVICGLGVYQNDDTSFSIETGMALDYMGREIVVSAPVIRNIRMVDGYENLRQSEQAYLCLRYAQSPKEPVNNIGAADPESEQFNKTEETYSLYLSTEEPNFSEIYGSAGLNDVKTVYSEKSLKIIRIIPKLAMSGDEMSVRFLVLKSADSQPLSFTYSFKSEFFKQNSDSTSAELSFTEDKNRSSSVFITEFTLHTAFISETQVPFIQGSSVLKVNMGDFSDKTDITEDCEIYLCGSSESYSIIKDTRMSTLENHISGENTPVYLAKIDCMNIGTGFIIRSIKALPFEQRVILGGTGSSARVPAAHTESGAVSVNVKSENALSGGVTAETEVLEYWRKPQVSANYSKKNKSLSFRFGIPSSEAYDYATSSGTEDIPISGSIRVNSHFVSEEITHNLGIGDVSISVAVEYETGSDRMLLFGSGDVFSTKNEYKTVPRIECAALLNPGTGKFRIGIKLLDYVEGHSVRVRWFAYKPTRDTAAMRSEENVTVKISPDICKLKPLERVYFNAETEGTADKSVLWEVSDEDGGNIDQNGLYQAPSTEGTYEITATSAADENVKTSAFVIVEN